MPVLLLIVALALLGKASEGVNVRITGEGDDVHWEAFIGGHPELTS